MVRAFAHGAMGRRIHPSCSSVVRAFAHGAMGRRIDPSCSSVVRGVRSWCDGSSDRSFM